MKNFLLVFASTSLTFLALEVILTLFDLKAKPTPPFLTSPLRAYMENGIPGYYPDQECYQCYDHRLEDADRQPDLSVVADGKRYECVQYRIGPSGFRTPAFDRKAGPRILAIGDSFVFGEGVAEKDTFPRLIENETGVETINLAMQGLNTKYEHRILDKYIHLKPDLVILGYVLNDTMPHRETIRMVDDLEKTARLPGPFALSRLLNFLHFRITTSLQSWRTVRKYLTWSEQGWPASKRDLLAMRETCVDHGAGLLLLLFPMFCWSNDYYPFLDLHRKMDLFAHRNKIPFIDLFETYRAFRAAALRVHPLDHHPNARAHRMAFSEIITWIKGSAYAPLLLDASKDPHRPPLEAPGKEGDGRLGVAGGKADPVRGAP